MIKRKSLKKPSFFRTFKDGSSFLKGKHLWLVLALVLLINLLLLLILLLFWQYKMEREKQLSLGTLSYPLSYQYTEEELQRIQEIKQGKDHLWLNLDIKKLYPYKDDNIKAYYSYIQKLHKQEAQSRTQFTPLPLAWQYKEEAFPLHYTITGKGDLSFKELSRLFYREPYQAFYIAFANQMEENVSLQVGQKILIPSPHKGINLWKFSSLEDIPHLSDEDEIVDADGVIHGTPEEIAFYIHVVVAEASQQWDYEGTRMIAESICNRVRQTQQSLFTILTASRQYDVVSNQLYKTVHISDIQKQAALDALQEKNNRYLNQDVLFFATREAVNRTPWFQRLTLAKEYRGVLFFNSSPKVLNEILEENQSDATDNLEENEKGEKNLQSAEDGEVNPSKEDDPKT